MELFGKDDIEKVLLDPKTKDQISLYERVRWMKQVAEGMAWIHGAGIVHRDLKPSNILFDAKSRSVKVCDFGLSVLLPKGNKTQLDPKGEEKKGAESFSLFTRVSLKKELLFTLLQNS